MSKTEVESMNLANKDRESYIEVFLPESLVKLVLKIAKNFKLSCFDEFSILDTLQFACHKNFEHNFESKKDMTVFIMSVIRITEKFNKASLKVGIPQLGSSENLVQKEFKFFKSMDFHVCAPRAVETLHEMIESHLSEFLRKDFIFDFSVDILRIVYAERSKIYDVFIQGSNKKESSELKKNVKLMSAAVLVVVLKVLNVADRVYNRIFEAISRENLNELLSEKLNKLSAIIFDMIKH